MKKVLSLLALAATIALPGAATAARFAIHYGGTVDVASTFPEFPANSDYHVVLVFDNGGTTAATQVWTGANLTCVYYLNSTGSAAYAQNLVTFPPTGATGSATTDAAGVLTANFSSVFTSNDAAPNGIGFSPPLAATLVWFANGANEVFEDSTRTLDDAAGGVLMAPANWNGPVPWTVPCTAAAASAAFLGTTTTAVPTLSQWNIAILAGLLAIAAFFGSRRLRRR